MKPVYYFLFVATFVPIAVLDRNVHTLIKVIGGLVAAAAAAAGVGWCAGNPGHC